MARVGLTSDRVTRAAADLADEVGFENVKVSTLARGFGVKDASLYSHVRSLQDLRTRVAMLAARDLADRIRPAVAGRAGRDALTAFAHAYRGFARQHPGRYAAVQIPLDPAVAAGSAGHLAIIETTYAMLRAYGLAEPDLTDAVRLLRSAIHGYVDIESAGGFGASRAVGASWERSIEALHTLLEHWPKESGQAAGR